jgi:hypothetical protein
MLIELKLYFWEKNESKSGYLYLLPIISVEFPKKLENILLNKWDVENIILPFSHNLEFMFLGHFSFVTWADI